jgi:hypothetical protein
VQQWRQRRGANSQDINVLIVSLAGGIEGRVVTISMCSRSKSAAISPARRFDAQLNNESRPRCQGVRQRGHARCELPGDTAIRHVAQPLRLLL